MTRTLKESCVEGSSSEFFLLIPAKIKSCSPLITMSTLEPSEVLIFIRTRRCRLATSFVKDNSSDSSLLIPASKEKDGLIMTTSTPKPIKRVVFIRLMEKNKLNMGIDESSSFQSSNSFNSSLE